MQTELDILAGPIAKYRSYMTNRTASTSKGGARYQDRRFPRSTIMTNCLPLRNRWPTL
jgi:hypothetical protein